MALRTWRLSPLGTLAIVALVFAGCGSTDADDGSGDSGEPPTGDLAADTTAPPVADDEEAGDGPGVDTTEADQADQGGTDTSRGDPSAPFSVGSEYEADAEPLLAWFSAFEPGSYRTGALGTPMSFTATESLSTQPNGGGFFVLSDVSSRAPDDRDLVFMRVAGFSDPGAPNAPIEEQTPWPNDDFPGWLENLDAGVVPSTPVETSVNGLPAIRVDLELSDDVDCGFLPGSCVGLAHNGNDIKAMNLGASYRVWIAEQEGEDPLMIVAGIARDRDESWFARAAAVMDTIAFGEIEPNPVQPLLVGTNQLNALGGIEVDLPDNLDELTNGRPRLINQWTGRGLASIPITDRPGVIYLAERPHDRAGEPLASTAEVIDELTAAGAELTEVEATTIGGVDARVFDVMTSDVGAIMLRFSPLDVSESILGWDAPSAGRIWLVEHPERGLMMISTHAFQDVDEMLPLLNELGDAIVGSITFTP